MKWPQYGGFKSLSVIMMLFLLFFSDQAVHLIMDKNKGSNIFKQIKCGVKPK